MKVLGSVAALVAALQAEVDAEVEALERRTEERIAAEAKGEAEEAPPAADAEERLRAARGAAEEARAQEAWQDQRLAAEAREAWIGQVVEAGRRRLRDDAAGEPAGERIRRLALEGLARLPEGAVEVVVAPADAEALSGEWARELAEAAGRESVRVVEGEMDGGCVVRTRGGRASFDNTWAARERRFEAAWRAALAEIWGP